MPASLFASAFDQVPSAGPDAAGLVWRRPGWAPRPGPVWGGYPMLSLPAEQPNPLRAWWQQCRHHVRPPGRQARDAVVQRIRGLQAGWADLNEEAFALQVQRVRVQLLAQGLQGGGRGRGPGSDERGNPAERWPGCARHAASRRAGHAGQRRD